MTKTDRYQGQKQMMNATTRRPFKVFSAEESEIWKLLFERQFPRVKDRACRIYLEGHDILNYTSDRIPDFAEVNEQYKKIGWELLSTDVQYSDGQSWFEHLVKREFLITEYIRDMDTLDYTPLPDIWHDAFGHLPLMTNRRYADLVHKYAEVMLAASPEQRKPLGSIWWYTIEFGFIMEEGQLKAFGAGLMSSYEEIEIAYSDRMQRLPFDPETIGPVAPSPHEIHKTLWILDSFEQLEEFVDGWHRRLGLS